LSGHFEFAREDSSLESLNGQNWPVLRWLLKAQVALTLTVAIVTALTAGLDNGVFVMMGGLAAMLLTAIAAFRAFAVNAADDPRAALAALYRGLAAKIIGAVVLFIMVAKMAPQNLPAVIAGFAAATIAYWIALLWAPWPGLTKEQKEQIEDGRRDGR
jgi:F0F1-type ATP synthase assembly protein I